LHVINTTKN